MREGDRNVLMYSMFEYRFGGFHLRDANLASKFRIKFWTLSDQRGICFVWETLFLF